MLIESKDVIRLADGINSGLAELCDPSPITRIILLVNGLDDMIKNARAVGELADILDNSVKYPILVMDQGTYKFKGENQEGDYVINLVELLKYKEFKVGFPPVPQNPARNSELDG